MKKLAWGRPGICRDRIIKLYLNSRCRSEQWFKKRLEHGFPGSIKESIKHTQTHS